VFLWRLYSSRGGRKRKGKNRGQQQTIGTRLTMVPQRNRIDRRSRHTSSSQRIRSGRGIGLTSSRSQHRCSTSIRCDFLFRRQRWLESKNDHGRHPHTTCRYVSNLSCPSTFARRVRISLSPSKPRKQLYPTIANPRRGERSSTPYECHHRLDILVIREMILPVRHCCDLSLRSEENWCSLRGPLKVD
jgi:hypothetical protein